MSITATAIQTPPRVELVGSGLSLSAAWVRIERLWGEHSMVVVDLLPVSAGSWYAVDWDVPLGVSVTWRATATSAAGVVMGVETVAATTPPPLDDTQAWLSDPADPSTAMVVTLMEGTDEQAEHPMAWSGQAPMGRDLPTAVMGQRTYGQSRSLIISTATETEYRALEGLVMQAGVLLVRAAHISHRSGLIYLAAQISARPLHALSGHAWETDWLIVGDEVAPSTVGVIVPPRTWADVVAQHATWADAVTAYPTWLDLLRGPQ